MNNPLEHVITFLKQTDELKTGEILLDSFSKYARTLAQYDELAKFYEMIKSYHKSLKMLEKCLVLGETPDQLYSIRANLAKVYNHINDPEKSLLYSGINLQINSDDSEAKMEQSFSHYLLADYATSFQIQSNLLVSPDASPEVKDRITFNMGTFEMANGNFKSGIFKMIMGGKKIGIWPHIKRPYNKWDGKFTEKTVLVFAEAGIGDELANIRFMREFQKRGINAVWVSSADDRNEFYRSNGFICVNPSEISTVDEYVYCESMTLPVLFDLELHELWDTAYLTPKKEYIDKWKSVLPEKFITIRWSGNPYYDQDLHRSLDYELLVCSLAEFNIPLVSLQIDHAKINDKRVIDVDIKTWDDTIAIQHLAHLNITSCTSTAHSAGASAAKCVVLPPIATYYQWLHLRDGDFSQWYGDNLKVFPQTKHKSWKEPIDKTVELLRSMQ